jgi:hypothetical protein
MDGRGGLHDDVDVGIGQGVPNGTCAAFFQKCGRGAHVDALPALNADRFVHISQMCRPDDCVEAAPVLTEIAHALDFLADANASSAEDAFFGIADDRIAGKLDGMAFSLPFKMALAHAERVGEIL